MEPSHRAAAASATGWRSSVPVSGHRSARPRVARLPIRAGHKKKKKEKEIDVEAIKHESLFDDLLTR